MADSTGQKSGPWSPVNPQEPRIDGLGKFAVSAHNNEDGTSPVVFVGVVSPSSLELIIEGYNLYTLTLQVMDANTPCSPQVLISQSENAPPQLWLWMDSQKTKFYGNSWTSVDPADTNIIRLGKFAVTEHNREAGTIIAFRKVVSGSHWKGFNVINFYGLTLEVEDDQTQTPKVLVSEIPSEYPTLLFWPN